jgi:hypothetical protein
MRIPESILVDRLLNDIVDEGGNIPREMVNDSDGIEGHDTWIVNTPALEMYETYEKVEGRMKMEDATPNVTTLIAGRGDCEDEGVGVVDGTGGLNVQDSENGTVPVEVETETRYNPPG